MKRFETKPKGQQGFTLIELSIVLVIIGLIVGGVLVGQDLIRAAEIRATVSQLEKYNSAVNTFRSKYGYIPGDIPSATATQFSFAEPTDMTGLGAGLGDGNGLIEAEGGGASDATAFTGETIMFWNHLSAASLLDGAFGGTAAATLMSATAKPTVAVTAATMNQWVPPAKLARGNYLFVYYSNGYNYFQIVGASGISTAGVYTLTNALTPIEARNIDAKIDDGLPTTGIAIASDITTNATTLGLASGSAATGKCVNTATPASYTVTTTDGNTPLCGLRVRFN